MAVPLQRALNGYRLRVLGAGLDVFIRNQFGVHDVSLHPEQILFVFDSSSWTTGLQRSSGTTRVNARVTIVPADFLR